MLMFGNSKNKNKEKDLEIQRLLVKIINVKSRLLDEFREGPRGEVRADLALVVIVVPEVKDRPERNRAFATVTKEVSSTGMSLVLNQRLDADKVFVAVELDGEMKYLRAEVRHQDPLGAGLLQAGLRVTEIVAAGDFPELMEMRI